MIEAVIFDLDGVIADTVELYYIATKRVADEIGVPFDRQLNQKLQGMSRQAMVEALLGEKAHEWSEEEKRALGDLRGQYYRELIEQLSPSDVLPGMMELLCDIQRNGVPMALASSSSNAHVVVERLNVRSFFDVIVDVKTITRMKPDPEIFLTAARQLRVDPSHCVAIEDGEAGMKAIKQANMFSVGIGVHLASLSPDWLVQRTTQLTWDELKKRFMQKAGQ
ncbi:beta-phosphoglucomutase [Anoxybacillus gonensis]|uniref:Beta-phosphoglucomutase n=1 Tax=Anoxybacillus gonensis TaxID=198467 RepID=A0AAW7TIC6_9BACL|nr:beta-phosphoglucomutase [Anoxybacillus gonensis]AKS39706.1 beta-phosphoglucomutase [Anoxybacillus gonensis]KGP61693.1 beta-phosphoglucomutase [Anoxybacillus gonensis]MDO0878115.1 beta-phosphoglucomutase [Anoxybacillus gonensis]